MAKSKVKRISIDEEKETANEQWQVYLSQLTKENLNRLELIFQIQKLNDLDRKLIGLNRRDLLK